MNGQRKRGPEFSYRTREQALDRFRREIFDILVIGGGITGAAVARDAASRGLKVALVEKQDFAWGTSSRSSKLIHGGLRYLQNLELGLVFEALAERAFLMKTVPHMVRPLPFYLPIYEGDSNHGALVSMGLWLYDLLALFKTPEFHRRLSKRQVMEEIPFLRPDGLRGGFRYFDASMWDDVLTIETLRSASSDFGAVIANYVEAFKPIWSEGRLAGFWVRDQENSGEIELRAGRVVVCAGPWTDHVGRMLEKDWGPWLRPSKGVHLVFDLKRIPVPGAMVMNHPGDGRIAFVIPRPDLGTGVVIVGTTDAQSPGGPENSRIDSEDVQYLMDLLRKYFPGLNLKTSDILSAYFGVRPLMGKDSVGKESEADATVLQRISREHHIDRGPGGSVVVAGGKYTTHRKMAEEIVDFALAQWKADLKRGVAPPLPREIRKSRTNAPVNPSVLPDAIEVAQDHARKDGGPVPVELFSRYGAGALEILELHRERTEPGVRPDPPGFPCLASQLRFSMRHEMTLHLEDFYLRRMPLYLSRADHGFPWAEDLARVWAQERNLGRGEEELELVRLSMELEKRSSWTKNLG